ncbi:GNAT family N-acetyltransferase [Pseudomonas edaphica]|jgi:RimJ/RimL family protein N-acetyltransferase|uniref:GNAT family N-acetyltransferase n=2 Tax=Gammaproteobacteria TaxID=1236 RepID=A0A5R8QTG7_9PSED|nr:MULTISPECIES: GNAT family N-acetyltransferase [Pseudomonas]MCF5233773.1 GNAT family N-acetyltransferase [Pseudomonas sp. PA-5-4H]MCF5237715.1 GNAT family N-acetyltransferase [Pseudomonas sp. PA-5-4G]MCF5250633.1 GNAT family N-acetyltransferase [Pseudomonas sp. PA-5-4B]MCF5255899.1 GNAT family N-acetyltransferase [Pseudomonas sp. PA-5-4B]MCF5263245.1 GNAT family N-acetyltransferase [Pseudomonas sp. PA-5-4A]
MLIRPLGAHDAEAYRALMLEAYGAYPQAFTSSVAERARMPMSWWEKRLDNPLDRVLGAFAADTLAGIVGLAFEPREKARHKVTLFGMFVTEAYQRKGLGRELLEAALDAARRQPGVKLIQLTVTAGNDAAFALYQRCGFIQYGLEPLAVRVGIEYFDKVHMWRELKGD